MARLIEPPKDDITPLIQAMFAGTTGQYPLGRINRLQSEGTRRDAEREMRLNTEAAGVPAPQPAPQAPPPATFAQRFAGDGAMPSAPAQEAWTAFLNNPEAREQLFQSKFGEILRRYGVDKYDRVTRGIY
jgi:hypothetical protein